MTDLEPTHVGRRQEIADVTQLLTSAHLVTLTGVGGCGKSALARAVTANLAAAHPGRVWLVQLGDVRDPARIGDTIALELGIRLDAAGWQASRLAAMTDGQEAWLVLDDCEHLLEACAAAVEELLAAAPRLRVLATSRQRLGLPEEQVYVVPALADEDAVTLFAQRAATLLPGFAVTEQNRETITALCAALEGLPLAIELAAARIRVLAPQTMLERLSDRYALLSRAPAGTPARQSSLEASVAWSHTLCSPQEQLLWARLSVFSSVFSLDAAEAVCAGDGIETAAVLDLLADLIDRSLLTRVDDDTHSHYRMLASIRQFGAARLAESGEADTLRARHRDWFLALAEECGQDWVGPRQDEWVRRLRTKHPDLRDALEHAAADPASAPAALRAAVALRPYWITQGLLTQARGILDQALAHGTGTVEERVLGLFQCGYFAAVQRDLTRARECAAELESLVAGSDDPRLLGYDLYLRAGLAAFGGDVANGLALSEPMLAQFRAAGRADELATAEGTVALWLSYAGEVDRAVEILQAGLEIMRPQGDAYFSSYSLWILGNLALARDNAAESARLQREALRSKWALGDELGVTMVLEALAAACVVDEALLAMHMVGAADTLWRRVGPEVRNEPHIRAQREATLATARRVLDDRTCEEALELGGKLPLEKVVTFALGRRTTPGPADQQARTGLTAREEEVAALLGEGLTNQEIADRLVISLRTAQGHVENILRKLGFSSRTQVATWVVRQRSEPDPPPLRVVGET